MSSIYNTEPQPTASVILRTNHGDLSVELFAKQTPLTCRNFLQHCLDGYYDNTTFHRLVPGFILQGGDPSGTGNGGESIYDGGAFSGDLEPWPMDQRRGKNAGAQGVNFKDEYHSRLKFNRRGLLGMANEGTLDTNGSQFFFTLDQTDELNGKNTMFGRVAGETIYNLAKMGEAEVEEGSDRPLYPTKIASTEILVNPFDDMRRRERIAQRTLQPSRPEKKNKKRKVGKQLLSFGDDDVDVDTQPLAKKPKFDTRIVTDVEEDPRPMEKRAESVADSGKTSQARLPMRAPLAREMPITQLSDRPPVTKPSSNKPTYNIDLKSLPESKAPSKKTELERVKEEIAALKAAMKRPIHSTPMREEEGKSVLEKMVPETSTRGRRRRARGHNPTAAEERKALDFLKAFKCRLDKAPPEKAAHSSPTTENGEGTGAAADVIGDKVCDLHFIANCQSCQAWDKAEAQDESDDEGWMSHSLSFAADKLGKDLSYRKKADEELIVIDPLQKARSIQAERRAEVSSGGRGGSSGRAWGDLARNAQMARAASLAGRGAK